MKKSYKKPEMLLEDMELEEVMIQFSAGDADDSDVLVRDAADFNVVEGLEGGNLLNNLLLQ